MTHCNDRQCLTGAVISIVVKPTLTFLYYRVARAYLWGTGGHAPQWQNGYKFLSCYTGTLVIYNMYFAISSIFNIMSDV